MMNWLESRISFREFSALQRIIASFLVIFESVAFILFQVPLTPRGEKLDYSNYHLVWADEFDGDSLDLSKWTLLHNQTKRRGGYWDIGQATVSNGYLTIRTEFIENGKYGSGWYSAGISTERLFEKKYGYFECSCKCPGGQGLWAAFWMFCGGVGNIDGSGKDGAEIDIFESPNYNNSKKYIRNSVNSTIHYDGYGENHIMTTIGDYKVKDPYNEFNTYGLLWNEEECVFYINGVETNRLDGDCISEVEEFLILSVEVNGNNCIPGADENGNIVSTQNGNITYNDESKLPLDFIVDYVRVYDKNILKLR